jgi:hypothetical protein
LTDSNPAIRSFFCSRRLPIIQSFFGGGPASSNDDSTCFLFLF